MSRTPALTDATFRTEVEQSTGLTLVGAVPQSLIERLLDAHLKPRAA